MVNEDVTLKVDSDKGVTPTNARWDFADGRTAKGTTVTHRWAAAQAYLVTVQATMPDGQHATTGVSIQVSLPPHEPVCGEVITTSVVLTGDLTCTGTAATGLTIAASDVVVDLGGHTLSTNDSSRRDKTLVVAGSGTLSRITIRNGTIYAYGIGLSLTDTDTVSIVNVNSFGHSKNGLAAIYTDRARGLQITGGHLSVFWPHPTFDFRNQTTATISDANITGFNSHCWGASTCTIERSTVDILKIQCDGGATLIARNNTIHEMSTDGDNCASATVTGNTVDGPMGFSESSNYQVAGNTFTSRSSPLSLLHLGGGHGTVTDNTFTSNPYCGLRVETVGGKLTGPVLISGNTFTSNGHGSGGATCSPGDGLRIDADLGADITVSNNHTQNNAVYGIRATPGTVIDGGGNTSTGDPNGCLGVVCT